MSKSKLSLLVHLIAQIVAQGAVVELVPANYKPVFMAVVAIIGVIAGFLDTTAAQQKAISGKKL